MEGAPEFYGAQGVLSGSDSIFGAECAKAEKKKRSEVWIYSLYCRNHKRENEKTRRTTALDNDQIPGD